MRKATYNVFSKLFLIINFDAALCNKIVTKIKYYFHFAYSVHIHFANRNVTLPIISNIAAHESNCSPKMYACILAKVSIIFRA